MQATTPEPLRPIYPYLTMISAIAIVVTACYLLICVQRVFFGEISEEHDHHVSDVRVVDKAAITVLATSMIAIGLVPALMGDQVRSGIVAVLQILGVGGA
jgi:NADH:ubiquinone oxidoreductase subunit 4 (subunit M)